MDLASTCRDIAAMRIRGAEAIGVAAARALADHVAGGGELDEGAARLLATRPTAVTLQRAVEHVREAVHAGRDAQAAAAQWAHASEEALAAVVAHAASLFGPGKRVLTHCHSSTVVKALAAAHDAHGIEVTCTETRPFDQGRITSRQLAAAGVPVTLVVDSAVASLMPFDLVVVGADTVARDGSLYNKVGTLAVATLAHLAGVPFHCLTTSHKFSRAPPGDVAVEERDAAEVWDEAPRGVGIRNPVFDRTPAELVTTYVTEHGSHAPAEALDRAWGAT